MAEPETPDQVIDRIGRIPGEERTKAQNRAYAVAINGRTEASRARARKRSDVGADTVGAVSALLEPCPFDRTSPEGIRWILDHALAGIDRIARAPVTDLTVTNRDRLDAASMLRMAAGLGKEAPVATEHELDMRSMLGAAPDVTCPGCGMRFDPEDGAAGNVGPVVGK